MADVKIVKSIYTGGDVTSLGELAAADNARLPGTLQVDGATTLGSLAGFLFGTAGVVSAVLPDGWTPGVGSWSYASATTITVPSGAASLYQKGDKIKLTQTSVKYFYIIGVADTLLTVTGGTTYTVESAAITSPFYSHVENPLDFPQWFAVTAPVFDVTYYDNGSGGQPTTTDSRMRISGRQCTVHYRGNGTKATVGTTNIIITSHSFPAIANSSNLTPLGMAIAFVVDPTVLGVVCNNGFTIYLGTAIADNAVIGHLGFSAVYEI